MGAAPLRPGADGRCGVGHAISSRAPGGKANGNYVAKFEDVQLGGLPKLSTLYLEHSPLARDFEYRMRLAEAIPSLTQLDATVCRGAGAVVVAPTNQVRGILHKP